MLSYHQPQPNNVPVHYQQQQMQWNVDNMKMGDGGKQPLPLMPMPSKMSSREHHTPEVKTTQNIHLQANLPNYNHAAERSTIHLPHNATVDARSKMKPALGSKGDKRIPMQFNGGAPPSFNPGLISA